MPINNIKHSFSFNKNLNNMKNNYLPRIKAVVALLVLLFAFFHGAKANPVGRERAQQLASNFLNVNGVRSSQMTDVTEEVGFSNVYVFTTENGFVIMAADDCVQPILGYSLNGSFDYENMPINKRAWIQEYNDQIQSAIDNRVVASSEVRQQWRDLAQNTRVSRAVVVGPLIQTKWNQGSPYNQLCPSGTVTGCVATAMAQVMKYWNYPSHGISSHSYVAPGYGTQTANFQTTTYDWSHMTNEYSSSSTDQQKTAVATLMYHCGVSVDMTYGTSASGGSGANSASVASALKAYFGYSKDVHFYMRFTFSSDDDWINLLKTELNQNRPIQYSGSGSGGGHSFVCDGYRDDNYFHFNWGWGGFCDEYYLVNNLNPGPGGIGSGSNGVYNDQQSVVVGIHPSGNTSAPSNLTYSVSGTSVNLSWSAASGASSYSIYRDNILVGTSTSTSYTVPNCHGTMAFYVRSVNSSGEASLSTNVVTATISYATPVVDDLAATLNNRDVALNWSAPDWCYPSSPTGTLTHGDGSLSGSSIGYGSGNMYWGHRYPASSLSSYNNKLLYKVSFYVNEGGPYKVHILNGTQDYGSGRLGPLYPLYQQEVTVASSGWYDVDLTSPLTIDGSQDYWVFIQDMEGKACPATLSSYSGSDGNYYSTNIFQYIPNTQEGYAFLIRTYVADGASYTYDLYRNGSTIATNLSTTTYNDNNLAVGTYSYYLKTRYSGGVTGASNTVSVTIAATMFDITATADPTTAGTITGAGSYAQGSSCTLVATPATGYHFVNWTKNGTQVSTNASYTFTVNEAAAYVAHFEQNSYTVTASATPSGYGTVSGGGTFTHGATCTLIATPAAGHTFLCWMKDGTQVSSNATYTFTVTESATYVARFERMGYIINATADPTEGGTVSGDGVFYYNQNCTLTATPATGYHFVNWTKNGTQVSTNASYTFAVTQGGSYIAHFQQNTYEISASCNPTGGGTITGAGTYNYGQSCTLSVTANPGYTFINWTKNGTQVSTNTSYTFTVTEAAEYVANFEVNGYEITATADPTAGGTITGAGVFNYNQSCTLTATAATGYTFVNWTKNGTQVSTNASYTFTVTESAAYVAHFQINSYQITATANPTAGGTVTGAGTYNHGESCSLTATAATGYTFVNWTKNGTQVSTNATYTFTVTEAASYVAHFQINTYEISATASPTGAGTITGTGTYNYNQTCTLVATATIGYTFVNWTKDGEVMSTSPNYSFTVTQDANYVANFQLNSYEITVSANPSSYGTVSGGGTYNHGESCTLIATPGADYLFVNWTHDGTVVSTSASYTFTVTEAGAYVANFVPNSHIITVSANPTSGGTVTGGGEYSANTTCTITATARTGYTFLNWTKDGTVVSTNTTYSFTVTEDATYVAHFQINTYEVTATADPTDGGTIAGAGTYNHGQTCTLTATAAAGYTFTNWTKNGSVVSTSTSYSFTVTEDASFVAHFSLNMYMISVAADPAAGGSVSGGGAYLYGENCTVIAMPNNGYTFTNWTKNGTVVSTSSDYTFTVTQDADLVAHFSLDHYNITVSVDPEAAGTATGGGSFTYGQTCTLTATANTGYSFVNWTKNGSVVSTNASYSFTVTGSGSYVANFAISYHTITVVAEPAEGGAVYGGGTYQYNHITTLRAVVNEGYTFINWTKDGVNISNNPVHPVIVREDAEYVANFRVNDYEIKAKTDPEYTGDITGAGFYNYGETCTLSVTPHDEYEFINWTLNGEVVSEDESFSFVVTEANVYIAHLQHVDGVGEQSGIMVSLFPNPAKNKLTIEASEPVNLLEIYTINGALVYRQNDCSDKIEINVQNYAIGTYMIRLTTDSTVEIRRFVKE